LVARFYSHANEVLVLFVTEDGKLYGEEIHGKNIHGLIYLANNGKNLGLWMISVLSHLGINWFS
jgi:hypothetical protein